MRQILPACFALLTLSFLGCSGKSAKEFTYLEKPTVLITEVHYAPSEEQGDAEFIEIANVTLGSLDLEGWQVTGAGRVSLPAGTSLESKSALVLCRKGGDFLTLYPEIQPAAFFEGKLSNKKGEVLRVEDPHGRVADEAAYDPVDAKVKEAAKTGKSLHRARVLPVVWHVSEPSPGRLKSR